MNVIHPSSSRMHRPTDSWNLGRSLASPVAAWAGLAVAFAATTAPAWCRSQITSRVSVSSTGAQANDDCAPPAVSSDGRYVVFRSFASSLVAGDVNGFSDVFLRDRVTGVTSLMSVDSAGQQGNQGCDNATAISADGRYVAFAGVASNLVAGDTNSAFDIFVHDRVTGVTTRESVDSSGNQASGDSRFPSLSADGRYVAFASGAANLVPGDTNFLMDVFVHDRVTGQTVRVSVDSNGQQGNGNSFGPVMSADGRLVGFTSLASNLVPGDTNNSRDAFVHDMTTGSTTCVSVDALGNPGDGDSVFTSFSADNRYVAFHGGATNLVTGDTNFAWDVFVRDLSTGTTTRVSLNSSGIQGNLSSTNGALSADGRYVAFSSQATNLVAGDTNNWLDVFVRDRVTGVTERASVSSAGVQGDTWSDTPVFAAGTRLVVFASASTNLVAGDTNGFTDIFVRDRNASGSTSVCDPGAAGVIACPCSNPPSGPGRGCDNSAATGGATIGATGSAYLSTDSLVFTTSGEKPMATSVLLQGTSSPLSGFVYGQGVRCVGGVLKRLYTKAAVAGSITAPDFGAGDPTVSTRSAAKGNVIGAGESRWYLVYYRDPIVLGGCPAASTFNTTQTVRIDWSL
jgi:Tol biopolymer transport system component